MAEVYVKRKLGKEKVEYLFPQLQEILGDTYGIILYQEQVMRISVKLASFAMSKADEMRKIMGKKLTHKLPPVKKAFMEGGAKKGFNKKKLGELFSQMETFAEYGFNKSHSTAYAFLAYQTAYLKAHYPVYFMMANLSSEADKTTTSSKVIQYITETKKMGIDILPPDINKSSEYFSVESGAAIRFGLKGLKNVGSAAIHSLLHAKEQEGAFKDYSDFITRIDLTKVNKAVLESLIKSGALSCFNLKRRTLFDSVEEVIKQGGIIQKHQALNQKSLFTEGETAAVVIAKEYLETDEWSESEIIKHEKEVAGIYITFNPLEKFRDEIIKVSNTDIASILAGEFKNEIIRIGGVITEITQRKSKKGAFYGELFFEDLTGRIKILVFKEKWAQLKEEIKMDSPYFLEGRLPDNGDSTPNIYLENLTDLEASLKKQARKIIIKLNHEQLSDSFMDELIEKLDSNRDTVPYMIVIYTSDGYRYTINPDTGHGLKATLSMKKDIETLTSENTVEILF
jgi:DNA polymerase-3 subunit alpha